MNNYVIDSSAWIEYFDGSNQGKKVAEIVDNEKNKIITTTVSIAELSSFFKRKDRNFDEPYKIILKNSKIFHMNEDLAKEIGALHGRYRMKHKKISFADCFVLFAARKSNAKIITKDLDFKGFEETILL